VSPRTDTTSRSKLLSAGVRILARHPDRLLRRGLTADIVCRGAGVARRTFYDQFETVDSFVEELRRHVAADLHAGDPPSPDGLASSGGELHVAIGRGLADYTRSDRAVVEQRRAAHALGVVVPDPSSIPIWYSLIHELQTLGVARRDPSVVDATTSATDLLVRGYVASLPSDAIERADAPVVESIELLLATLIDSGDNDVDGRETRRTLVRGAWAERASNLPVPNVRQLVRDTAEDLISSGNAHRLSLDAVCSASGLSRSVVLRYVGDVHKILADIVDQVAPGLDVALRSRPSTGIDPRTSITDHARRVVGTVRRTPAFGFAVQGLAARERNARVEQSPLARMRVNAAIADLVEQTTASVHPRETATLLELLLCNVPGLMPLATDEVCTAVAVDAALRFAEADATPIDPTSSGPFQRAR
jgi:AcrR family transcriptional regulator